MEDGFREMAWMEYCNQRLKDEPASAKLIEERYMGRREPSEQPERSARRDPGLAETAYESA